MQVSFNCPQCSNVLQAESSWGGQQTQCPYCKTMILIPSFAPGQSQTITLPSNVPLNANISTGGKDFFLIRIFTALFNILRKLKFFNFLGKAHRFLAKFGAISYLALGGLLFIAACVNASKSSAGEKVLIGLVHCLAFIILATSGMYMFKLYDTLFAKGEKHTVPYDFLNVTAIISMAVGISSIIFGIVMACTSNDGGILLHKSLCLFMICLPVFIVSMSPASISISTGEQSSNDNAVGILFMLAKSALLAVPFLWCFDAVYKVINIIIHLGSDQYKLEKAYKVSSDGLIEGIIFPILVYIAYLLLNFVISAIKSFMDKKENN